MKIVQQVRGSKPNQDTFVGEVGQLTIDVDNWDIRLHDGVTPGGKKIIQRDNGDDRWQAKSVELDGFSFPASARGMVTRLMAGQYRIRRIVVNEQQLTIQNADGYGGNPTFGLAQRIETPHIFGDDILIEGVLQVEGGVNANTSGTHYGPVEGDIEGNLVGDSTGTHTGPTVGEHTGSVDVRGATVQFDDAQIPLSALDGLLEYIKQQAEEPGVIKMWAGEETAIPAGYALCNGLNGTPDLRNRFIVGAGTTTTYQVGDTGGNTTHVHNNEIQPGGSHTHDVEVSGHQLTESEMPAHKHGNGICDAQTTVYNRGTFAANPTTSNSVDNNGSDGTLEGWTQTVGGGQAHSHGASMTPGGTHTHELNNVAASSLPPYYALCYIMRLA